MKIGIITCFDLKNVNFGNRLQTYALNAYLNNIFEDVSAETLYFQDFKDFKRTKKEPLYKRVSRKVRRDFLYKKKNQLPTLLENRLRRFNAFSIKNTKLIDHPLEKEELFNLDYDLFLVGSDVVWYQWDYGIRPIKLLDFETFKHVPKVSYAASFGNDYIPSENRKELIRCFKSYHKISVREQSSVKLMANLGRVDAVHVMDPTLLLSSQEWTRLEKSVDISEISEQKYIFVYLLSTEKKDRENIERLAQKKNLKILTVPYASGTLNSSDVDFGDYQLTDCSPEEWLWLIHHAAFVITDSFHGVAFSVNYHTPFIVTTRKEKFEMTNRLKDFLQTISQEDKFVDLSQLTDLNVLNWNFDNIGQRLLPKIEFSKHYLKSIVKQFSNT